MRIPNVVVHGIFRGLSRREIKMTQYIFQAFVKDFTKHNHLRANMNASTNANIFEIIL